MSHAPFVHLRVRSCFSLLESAVRPGRLLARCRDAGMPAVAVTDRANLFAALEVGESAIKAGIQPIVGCLLPVRIDDEPRNGRPAPPPLLPLLVKDAAGYANLLKLLTRAYLDKDPAAPVEVEFDDLDRLNAGLIAFTGGLDGPLAAPLLAGNQGFAEALLDRLERAFDGRLYVEVMRHGLEDEDVVEPVLLDLAYARGLPLVATNDVHFLDADDYESHDVLLAVADSAQVAQNNRRRLTPEHRFKSAAEMADLFQDLPEALANTIEVARRCAFLVPTRAPILPAFPTAAGRSEVEELRAQAESGLEERLRAHVYRPGEAQAEREEIARPYRERLAYELRVIEDMKYPGYFLIVADFIKWAKGHGIPVGPGRGSGAGSVVAWSLMITDLDPLRFGLLFERFLNPERVSMPDFDIDFCQDRRDEVIRYVRDKYGHAKVAAIITFGKLQARAVLRDVGRALGMPYGQVDRVAKLVPFNPASPPTLEQALVMEPALREAADEDEQVGRLIEIAKRLEGLPRHASTHAAGVVIGDRPLDELIPLYRDPRASMPVTQFNMKDVEKAGLVKFDFLGLTTLTMLRLAEDMVNRRRGDGEPTLDLEKLGLDDQATYELLGRGETAGVFQLESGGMRDALRKLRPDCFEDIIAMVSLYRPGPMDNIPRYIACKQGVERPEYLHPLLEPILRETYGVIIYQEQVMQIAQELAGYSLGAADLLRRAMGKKIKAEMDAQREVFIEGAVAREVPQKLATTIFEQVAKFASYGFNKSHAAAYALLAYQTAYLKANHPLEFYAATMTMERANQDKLNLFRQEIAALGVALLPPDVNAAMVDFAVEDTGDGLAIRYALSAIRGVGSQAVQQIVDERRANGAYADVFDLVARNPGTLNRRLLENLIKAGALDSLDTNRARLLDGVERILRYAAAEAAQLGSDQVSLFAALPDQPAVPRPELPDIPPLPALDTLQQEFEVLGFYLSAHPLDGYGRALARLDVVPSSELRAHAGQRVRLAGVVLGRQERTTARSRFAFVQLSDPAGVYEITVFSELLGRARELLDERQPLLVEGEVRLEEGDVVKVLASDLAPLEARIAGAGALRSSRVEIRLARAAAAGALGDLLGPHGNGSAQVRLVLPLDDGAEVLVELPDSHRLACGRRIDLERRGDVLAVVDL
ncbi:MAG TPA: DNA polymerase III subunit alpha [Geminicoccaceae bacterium]